MPPFVRPLQGLLLALLLLPLAACDETGTVSDDVDVAVQDAVIARQSGDYDTAVKILERAHERDAANPKVRVELATTLLERDDIDLLDVDRIAQFISEGVGAEARTQTAPRTTDVARSGAACVYASDADAEAFEMTAIAGFTDLVDEVASIERANELLATVLPPQITEFDLCTNVVDGELTYDRGGALAALYEQGLSETQVRQVLAVNALARIIDAYLFVSTEIEQEVTWYRLGDGSVALCADDPAALQDEVEEAVAGFGVAVLSLDARASLLGNAAASDLVDLAKGAFEELRDATGDYCASV